MRWKRFQVKKETVGNVGRCAAETYMNTSSKSRGERKKE